MARVLQHNDLLIDTKFKNHLLKLDQLPAYKRRKLLNSMSGNRPYSRFLYKYRPLIANNTEQADRLRDYLVESRLWLSSPGAFNDPFDMRGVFTFEGKPQEKRRHLISTMTRLKPNLNKDQIETIVSNTLANRSVAEDLELFYEKHRNNVGICSFTEDTRNILMWAHYGSNHTGVSIQFRPTNDLSIFSCAYSVDYSIKYPVMDYLKGGSLQNIMTPMLLRKSNMWKYEQERRIFHPNGANYYLQFKPSALTALILGCEIGIAEENIIKMLLIERKQRGYPALKVFRAIRHRTEYRLCLQHQENWVDSESAQ